MTIRPHDRPTTDPEGHGLLVLGPCPRRRRGRVATAARPAQAAMCFPDSFHSPGGTRAARSLFRGRRPGLRTYNLRARVTRQGGPYVFDGGTSRPTKVTVTP